MKIIICDGATKSGSTLLFRIIETLLGSSVDFLRTLTEHQNSSFCEIYEGIPTGYVFDLQELIQQIASMRLPPALGAPRSIVIKSHGASLSPNALPTIPLDILRLYTIRNPLDTVKSLIDAGKKELVKMNQGLDFRSEFALLDSPQKAALYLHDQYNFALTSATVFPFHVIEYPDYTSLGTAAAMKVQDLLSIDGLLYQEACALVDRKARAGEIWTEFNVGVAGRGRNLDTEINSNLFQELIEMHERLRLL